MRPLSLFLKILLFLLLLGFAAKNSDPVALRYFLGFEAQAPLSLVILAAFAIGLFLGLLACSFRLLRAHRELRVLRVSQKERPQEAALSVPSPEGSKKTRGGPAFP